MKHLRDMRATFPHLHERSAIMGLAAGNIPPHEQRRREQEALEAKRARRQALPLRVSFTVRPGLPPCYTAVSYAGVNARVADVLSDAWASFTDERARRGAEIGPLPSYHVGDYCLCRFNGFTGEVGDECPPRALVARLVKQPGNPAAAATSTSNPVADDDAAFRPPVALQAFASLSPEGAASSTRSNPVAAAAAGIADTWSLEANHLTVVLRPVWVATERLASSERKTRLAIAGVFADSMATLADYEREKRSQAQGLVLQRSEFTEARVHLAGREERARDAIDADYQAGFDGLGRQFRERYAGLAKSMVGMLEKMAKLREQHQRVMEQRLAHNTVTAAAQ